MRNFHPQVAKDRRSVTLPIEEWQQIVEALEELEDIRACDEIKKRIANGTEPVYSIEEVTERALSGMGGRTPTPSNKISGDSALQNMRGKLRWQGDPLAEQQKLREEW